MTMAKFKAIHGINQHYVMGEMINTRGEIKSYNVAICYNHDHAMLIADALNNYKGNLKCPTPPEDYAPNPGRDGNY